jgi:WD40 repeat protein
VLVGTAMGDVLVFEFDGESFRKTDDDVSMASSAVPVADCASEVDSRRGAFPPDSTARVDEQCVAVTANDAGLVVAWDVLSSDSLQKIFSIQRPGPIVSLAARNGVVVIAESGGVLSFASTTTKRVFCETQAHARFLSAAALHPRRDIVATVAEDGTIAVWGMPSEILDTNDDDDKNEIAETSLPKSLFAARWPDGMLTGVAFCGDGDDALAVCAYDETEIVAWQ